MSGATHDPTDFYDNDLTAIPLADADSKPAPAATDVFASTFRVAQDDWAGRSGDVLNSDYGPVIEAVRDRTGKPMSRYIWIGHSSGGVNEQALFDDLAAIRTREPAFLADIPETIDGFHARSIAKTKERRARDLGTVERAGGVAGNSAWLAGMTAGGMGDPVNLMTMPFGGVGPNLARRVLSAAAVNTGVEALSQPLIAAERAKRGETLGTDEALTNIALAPVAGAVFQAGGEALIGSVRKVVKRIGRERLTTAERGAVNIIEREEEVTRSSPFRAGADGEEHALRLDRATTAINGVSSAPGAAPVVERPPSTLTQDQIIRFVLNDLEGGDTVVRSSAADGGTTKFGIAAGHNPGVDVANLTESGAAAIARRKYWFRGLDAADPRTAAVAFDAGYISGPAVGRRILAESGGDPARALGLYREHLNRIADTVHGKAKFKRGWNNRVDKLARLIDETPDAGPHLREEMFSDDDEWAQAQRWLSEEDAATARVEREELSAPNVAAEAPSPVRANLPSDAVDDFVISPISVRERAAPGYHLEPSSDGNVVNSVFRDADGRARAAVIFPATPEMRAFQRENGQEGVSVYVEPSLRRQGIATRLYDQLREAGYDIDALSGTSDLTPDGAAFVNARRARQEVIRTGHTQKAPAKSKVGKPVDLIRFLADNGGIRNDEGHDLVAGRNLQTFVPGRGSLVRAGGMPLDRAREIAAEAGYIYRDPSAAIGDTSVADFLDVLEGAKSRPRYALADLEEVARREFEEAWKADQEMRGWIESERSNEFDDPYHGTGPRNLVESLEHDLRMDVAANPDATVRLSDEGGDQLIRDVLDDLEADDAALSAARQCMTPPARAA